MGLVDNDQASRSKLLGPSPHGLDARHNNRVPGVSAIEPGGINPNGQIGCHDFYFVEGLE